MSTTAAASFGGEASFPVSKTPTIADEKQIKNQDYYFKKDQKEDSNAIFISRPQVQQKTMNTQESAVNLL